MKCFEVTINGEKVCTAGVGDDGVLTSIVSFVKINNASDETGESQNNNSESLDLRVGGSTNREFGATEDLEWLHQDLAVGDEIVIRIIEASACDEPKNKEVTYLECSFCGRSKLKSSSSLLVPPFIFATNVSEPALTHWLPGSQPEVLR